MLLAKPCKASKIAPVSTGSVCDMGCDAEASRGLKQPGDPLCQVLHGNILTDSCSKGVHNVLSAANTSFSNEYIFLVI